MKTIDLSCHQRTRGMVRALGFSAVLLLVPITNTFAQGLPPLPGDGKPLELSPEELARLRAESEARRLENEARWLELKSTLVNPLTDEMGRNTTYEGIHQANLRRVEDSRAERLANQAEDQRKTAEYLDKLTADQRALFDSGRFFVGRWFGDQPAIYGLDGVEAAQAMNADKVWPGGSAGLNLSGAGQTVAIFDGGGVRTSHDEFEGRVANITGNPTSGHATWTASTIAAGGVVPAQAAKGLAFQSQVKVYFLGNEELMDDAIEDFGVRFSNHSYSQFAGWEGPSIWFGDVSVDPRESYLFGFYGNVASAVDGTVKQQLYYLPVWSAGNDRNQTGTVSTHFDQNIFGSFFQHTDFHRDDGIHGTGGLPGGFDTVRGQSIAKNVLTVGAVMPIPGGYSGPSSVISTPYSNWGPTDDGRIKPDIVALGESIKVADSTSDTAYKPDFLGTSAAAPVITGGLVLLSQQHLNLHPTWRPLWGSTYKALVLHTAREAGHIGPDYKFGWGLADFEAAAQLMAENASSGTRSHIKEVTLHDGDSIVFSVSSTGTGPLKVTICWTDPGYPSLESLPAASKLNPINRVLVNDLDLRVFGGPEYQPWILDPTNPDLPAIRGNNNLDNVEQFVLENPGQGTFQVEITSNGPILNQHQGVSGSQNVSIIISGNVAIQPVPTTIASAMINPNNADELIFQWNSIVGQSYQVMYFDEVTAPAASWQVLQTVSATHPSTSVQLDTTQFPAERFLILKEDN